MTANTHLGNPPTASGTDTIEAKRRERTRDQHVIRRATRKALQGLVEHRSLVDCGNPLPGEDHTTLDRDPSGRVTVGKTVRCGSKQLCVTCAGRLRALDALLIAWRVFCHFLKGGGVSMMTVAPRHHRGEALAPNKVCLIESFNAAWRSKAMQAVRDKYGIVATARVFEITHGTNGWHPHLHILIFHARFLDITEGEHRELVVTFWREFNKQLGKWAAKTCQHPDAARAGVRYHPVIVNGQATKRRKATYKPVTNAEWYRVDPNQTREADLNHGIHFVPITPNGEAGGKIAAYVGKIQLEMTRSDLKTGKTDGSRSFFQIINDYATTNDPADRELIREASEVLKGVHLVVWSGDFHGDKPLYGEPTDEFEQEARQVWADSQGIELIDETERETIAGLAADVHRAADRADSKDGHPLLWQAQVVLEQSGQLQDVADLLNQVLAPVVIDTSGPWAYPIIRFDKPPTIELDNEQDDDEDWYAKALQRIRELGKQRRREMNAIGQARLAATQGQLFVPPPGERRQARPEGWIKYWKQEFNEDPKGSESEEI